jgi:hypothetical protein
MKSGLQKMALLVTIFTLNILAVLFLISISHTLADAEIATPLINEFVANHVRIDTHEYVEIFGDPDTDYSAYTILQIEGDSSAGTEQGRIDSVFPLGTTDSNGYWTTGFMQNVLENGTMSLLLVEGFSGVVGLDLDLNDDGVLDLSPWLALVDDIAVHDGGSGDFTYASVTLTAGYDGLAQVPGGASRLPNGIITDTLANWVRNDYDGAGLIGFDGSPMFGEAFNTPEAINQAVPALLVINEVDYDQPEVGGTAEFIEIKNKESVAVNLLDYYIELVDGESTAVYQTLPLPDFSLNPDDYFVLCFAALANCDLEVSGSIQDGAPDAVALGYGTVLVDVVSYEGDTALPYREGSGVGLEDNGLGRIGISRYPDGQDTNQNNVDFSPRCTTPGAANMQQASECDLVLTPSIAVTLTAVPSALIEPGGHVTFNLTVTNNGPITVTLSELMDDTWGDLNGQGTCAALQTIAVSDDYQCDYNGPVTGQGGEVVTHTAVVTGTSDNSLSAQDEAAAAVTIAAAPPPGIKVYLPIITTPDSDEPNNSCQEAHPIQLNQPGHFLPNDINDWYSFVLPSTANLQVSLTNFVPVAGQLLVYSGPCVGAQRIGHDGNDNVNRVLYLGVRPAGQYYIWVINDGPTSTTDYYTLTVTTP